MEELATISSILSNSNSFKDRRLGKKLQNPKESKMDQYKRKIYDLFLRTIDEESRARLTDLDTIINHISTKYLVNGGWHITNKCIFSENSVPVQVTDANGVEKVVYTYEMPRTETGYVQHDYVPSTISLKVIRDTEARFLEDTQAELYAINEAFNQKDAILANGEYSAIAPEYQDMLAAIERFMGYNKAKEEVIKK